MAATGTDAPPAVTARPPAAPGGAAERAAASLREDIRAGRLAPGQRLVEADLTLRLGVSRGPVREALGRLQSEGLVSIAPHRGAEVRRLTRRELAELFWVRSRLMGDAARLAAERIDAAGARRLRTELAHQRALPDGDLRAYVEANVCFHALLDELSGNAVLAGLLRTLETRAGVFLHLARASNTDRLRSQHVAISEAVLARDGAGAARLARQHVETVAAEIMALPDEWFAQADNPGREESR